MAEKDSRTAERDRRARERGIYDYHYKSGGDDSRRRSSSRRTSESKRSRSRDRENRKRRSNPETQSRPSVFDRLDRSPIIDNTSPGPSRRSVSPRRGEPGTWYYDQPGPSRQRRSRSPSPLYSGNSMSEMYGRLPSPPPLRFPSPPRPDPEPYLDEIPLRFPSPPRATVRYESPPPLRFPSPPRTTRPYESPIRSYSPSGRPLSPYDRPYSPPGPARSSHSPIMPSIPRLPSPVRNRSHNRSLSPVPVQVEQFPDLTKSSDQDKNLANLFDRMDPKDQQLLKQFQILQESKPELPFADYLLVTWDALVYKTRLLQFGAYLGKNRVHFVETVTPEDNLIGSVVKGQHNATKGSAVKGISTKRIQFEGSGRCLKAINPNARDNDQHKYEVRSLRDAMNNFFDTLEKGLTHQRPAFDGILLFSRYHKDMIHLIKAVKSTGTQDKFKRLIKGFGDLGHYMHHSHPDLHSMDLTQLRLEVLGEYTQGNEFCDVKAQKIYQIIEKLHKGTKNS